MYKSRRLRIFLVLIFGFGVFFCLSNYVLGFDLQGKIASKFKSYSSKDFSDENFSSVYSSNFSKDPFGDAMSNIENKSMQLKIAGVEYVENLLRKEGCSLSQKEVLGILYYYVPEFRTELVRSLKQEMGNYDNEKYVFSGEKVEQSCVKYFLCYNKEKIKDSAGVGCETEGEKYKNCMSECKKLDDSCCRDEEKEYEKCVGLLKWKITAGKPATVQESCKEFFKENYKYGQDNKEILQKVETAQIGVDKYRNNTTDDSPYDIMSDLGTLSKLLYYGVEDPIMPVIYNIPVFSNSMKKLDEKKNSDSPSVDTPSHGGNGNENPEGGLVPGERGYEEPDGGENGGEVSLLGGGTKQNPALNVNGLSVDEVKGLPLSYDVDGYDGLIEGLNSIRLGNDDSSFYSSLCEDDDEIEPEPNVSLEERGGGASGNTSDFSEEDYQDIIDYMIDAVDDYLELPEGKEEEIQQNMGDMNTMFDATSSEELEDAAEQIKNCWKSCEGLRVDQKASCMLKCACGEIKSPIFDPDKIPGLGPIFVLRFCAVPAVNTSFSVGGKRIYSIEEGLNEIYGAVDKLSREGKLGKWTQQYEFLDSSTKKMNIANTFAFSIDVDFVDIANKGAKHSVQYDEKDLEIFNKNALMVYGISNPLDNPSAKNVYRIDQERSEGSLKPLVDLLEDSRAYRYGMDEQSFTVWMDQQAQLWENVYNGILDYIDYSQKLYTKKS